MYETVFVVLCWFTIAMITRRMEFRYSQALSACFDLHQITGTLFKILPVRYTAKRNFLARMLHVCPLFTAKHFISEYKLNW